MIAALQERYAKACAELGDCLTQRRRIEGRIARLEALIDALNVASETLPGEAPPAHTPDPPA